MPPLEQNLPQADRHPNVATVALVAQHIIGFFWRARLKRDCRHHPSFLQYAYIYVSYIDNNNFHQAGACTSHPSSRRQTDLHLASLIEGVEEGAGRVVNQNLIFRVVRESSVWWSGG